MPIVVSEGFSHYDRSYRGALANSSWTLCVGAGISSGLVPVWQELTRRVVNDAFGYKYDAKAFAGVLGSVRFGLDAYLQGALNHLLASGKSVEEFGNLLENALYADLLSEAKIYGLDDALSDALNNVRWLDKNQITALTSFFDTKHAKSTLLILSKALARANQVGRHPTSVINFNADTLLYALLDLFLIRAHASKQPRWEHPPAVFTRAFRGIDGVPSSTIPIYHCHGAIAPSPKKSRKKDKRRDARDHLIFTEADYLSVAGNMATWAQSLFLFHAQSSRLLIIGHSLSDPNIRKWLGWSRSTSIQEQEAITSAREFSPRHIWIARRPKDGSIQRLMEASLAHLGVRPCWIKDWPEVGEAIDNLLAI